MNQPTAEAFELRFIGGDITPSNVRAHDVASVLEATEDLLASSVLRAHPELSNDDIIIGITSITSGSLVLRFSPSLPTLVLPIFEQVTTAIQSQSFERLPQAARLALRKIATFTRKNRCIAEFRAVGRDTPLAVINADLVIADAVRMLMQTTLYGRVLNAGGKNPNVHIETLQGDIVICSGNQEQIKLLAGRLYNNVGIVGIARCNVETLEISEFEIEEVLVYEETPITSAFAQIAEVAGHYFDHIDAADYVRILRSDELEA